MIATSTPINQRTGARKPAVSTSPNDRSLVKKTHRNYRLVRLSLQDCHRNEIRLPRWSGTALLFACRETYNEVLDILLDCNTLHFPALRKRLMLNNSQQMSFSFLRHVSFDSITLIHISVPGMTISLMYSGLLR